MLGVVGVMSEVRMALTLTMNLIGLCFDHHPTTIDRLSPKV
jgi:hypothetical protein